MVRRSEENFPPDSAPALGSAGLSRREVLQGLVGVSCFSVRLAWADERFVLPETTLRALDRSPYVYVSPLHPDAQESQCHAEVWFFHHQGDVIIATAPDRWKARALDRGWDKARIWAGDFGRVKRAGERFRKGPSFVARARHEPDPAVFERLMQAYARKYPEEWSHWKPRFRSGHEKGSRILIRYQPIQV